MELTDLMHQLRLQVWDIRLTLWQQAFLTARWWGIAIAIALSYLVWWKLTDKRRIIELLLFGSLIAVTRVIFDNWGISSGHWTYVIDLIPIGYSLFLNDLTVVPLAYMLAYQYSLTWKRYLVSILVVQSVISFIFLPILSATDILLMHNWNYAYTFIFMIIIAIIMRAIILFGLKLQEQHRIGYVKHSSSGVLKAQPALKPLGLNKKYNDED